MKPQLIIISAMLALLVLQVTSFMYDVVAQGTLHHYTVYVNPRSFSIQRFYVEAGNSVAISFYVYRSDTMTYSDIVFRIFAPDGRELYPQTRIYGGFNYSFVANQAGYYTLEFDNTYSTLGKRVDLAVVVARWRTVTATTYATTLMYIATTITRTVTAVVFIASTQTTTSIWTVTRSVTLTKTTAYTITETQVIERVRNITETLMLTTTIREATPTTIEVVRTVTEKTIDIPTLIGVAVALLVIGVAIGIITTRSGA